MSQRNLQANGSRSSNNGSGVSVSVNTGWASLIPGSSVSVRPVLTQTMTAGHN